MCWLWSAGSCVQPWNSLNWFRIFFYVFWQKNSTSKAQKVGSRVPCYCLQRLYTVISRRAYVGAGLLHRTETEARLLELRTRALPFLPQPIPQGAVCFFFLIPFFMWSRQCGCLTACYWSLFLTCECVDDTKAWTWKWMTLSLRLFFYCETSRNSLLLINGRGNTAKSTYWASIARWISFRVHGLVWSKLSWHWRGLRKIIFEYFK